VHAGVRDPSLRPGGGGPMTTTTTSGHVTHEDVADLMDDHAETSPVTPITAPEPAPNGSGEDDDGKTPLPVRLARLVLDHHWMVMDGGQDRKSTRLNSSHVKIS